MASAVATRRELFGELIAVAEARVVELAGDSTLSVDDAGFLVRAIFDLETDGAALFDPDRAADEAFFDAVSNYLAARVGAEPVRTLALGPFDAGVVAGLPPRRQLEDAALELVIQSEVKR